MQLRTFQVFQQLPPQQFNHNWFSVLWKHGTVLAVGVKEAIQSARSEFRVRHPILEEIEERESGYRP